MELIKDVKLFAKDKGVSPSVLEDFIKSNSIENLTYPTIVEERNSAMRAVEMNVFSRLIQDRIVFLSGDVTPDVMDVIVAQMLYLDSVDNIDTDFNLFNLFHNENYCLIKILKY